MPREASGYLRRRARGWTAYVRVAPNDRRAFQLAISPREDERASARAALLVDMSKRLEGVASADEVATLLRQAGLARTDPALAAVTGAVDAIASGQTRTTGGALSPTFEAFAEEWTSGRLRKKHPDHVREKDATGDLRILRKYVTPILDGVRLPDVTLDHAERVMARVPAELSPSSRLAIAQCMRKVLSLAVYPGRHIAASPIPREWMPKTPRNGKAKSCLYPAEDAKLTGCAEVPLERRLAYGILAREGMRASELACLRWRDVDLEHGRVRLDANKTDDPRAWALSADVVRVLAWWKKRTTPDRDEGATDADVEAARDADLVLGIDLKEGAARLRGKTWDPKTGHRDEPGDLRTAGVTRPELFERSKTRQPIRLHDLRATFVTVSLANGKTEQWVTDRTGHRSSQMLALYTRQARTWAELELGTLRPLDELLPEMRDGSPATPPEPVPAEPHEPRGARRRGHRRPNGARIAPPVRLERTTFALGKRCSIH